MKCEVYPVGPEDRTGACFTGVNLGDSFMDWELANAQNLLVDGHKFKVFYLQEV